MSATEYVKRSCQTDKASRLDTGFILLVEKHTQSLIKNMMFLDGLEKGMMMAGLKVILFSCNAAVQFWNQQQEPCWLKQEFVWLFFFFFCHFCFVLFCSVPICENSSSDHKTLSLTKQELPISRSASSELWWVWSDQIRLWPNDNNELDSDWCASQTWPLHAWV